MKRLAEWGLLLVLVGSVLVFGAVQTPVYSSAAVAIFLLVLLALIPQLRRGQIDFPIPLSILPFVLLVALQLLPLPSGIVSTLSPTRLLDMTPLGPSADPTRWATLGISSHHTMVALVKLLAYCGAFALAAFSFDLQKRNSYLIRGLILLGCFEAAYGIVQYLADYQKIFTYTKQFYTDEATGTYINRNHFAGFLEMVIPLTIGLMFFWAQTSSGGSRFGSDNRKAAAGPPVILYAFLGILMLVAVFFSRSRAGIFSALATLVFLAALGRLRMRRGGWFMGMVVILTGALVYALWIGINPVLSRFELLKEGAYLEVEGRLPLWRSQVPLIRDYPLLGTGLGTFGVAFRRYQDTVVDMYVDHAHNDYLEFAAETGLVGFLLLFVPILYLWGKMILTFLRHPSRYCRSVLLGCIGAVTAILIHTVTDFNLQIPANALVFSAILGIGYKATLRDDRPARGDSEAGVSAGRHRDNP